MAARLVLSTCPDEPAAARIARELVGRGLAACVTRVGGAVSVYRWQGRVEEAAEVQLLIKTSAERLDALMRTLCELHPDAEPECLAVEIAAGSPGYLDWVEEAVEVRRG